MQATRGSRLVVVEDKDLVRHPSLAYLDGYADARASGKHGFWMPDSYNRSDREAYLQGFNKGLRVHALLQDKPEGRSP